MTNRFLDFDHILMVGKTFLPPSLNFVNALNYVALIWQPNSLQSHNLPFTEQKLVGKDLTIFIFLAGITLDFLKGNVLKIQNIFYENSHNKMITSNVF